MRETTHRRRVATRLAAALAVIVAMPALATLASGPANAVPAPPGGFTTIWSDDFSGSGGSALNTSNWLYDLGHGYPGGATNWGTGEIESATNSTANVYQDGNGHLAIKPIRDGAGNWTSGRVETQRTDFAAPAGGVMRVEASIQQPNVSTANGAGYWPAFWMLGGAARPAAAGNWPSIGEVDILEDINGRGSEFATLHCGVGQGGPCNETTGIGSGERACGGCQTGFHTYAAELDRSTSPEQIRYYLDGNNFFTIKANQVDATTWANAVDHGFFIILNVAIGGGFPDAFGGGPNGATVSGQPMLVDYVSVSTRGGSSGGGGSSSVSGNVIAGPGGKCVDVGGDDSAGAGGVVQLWDCQSGAVDQHWSASAGSLKTLGRCLDVSNNGTGNGSLLQLWDCTGGGAQQWVSQADGSLRNPQSGRCLDSPGGATGNGTRLQIWDCNGSAAQKFSIAGGTGGSGGSGAGGGSTGGGSTGGGSTGGGSTGGVSATSTLQAEAASAQSGTQLESSADVGGGQDVGWIGNGDWLQFNGVDFGSAGLHTFSARVASGAAAGVSGIVEVHLDSLSNPVIGSFSVGSTGGWQSWRTVPGAIATTTGTHTVFVKFVTGSGQDFTNINWVTFS